MILDGHIHINAKTPDRQSFLQGIEKAGICGGTVLSQSPQCFRKDAPISTSESAKQRLEGLLQRTAGDPNLFPFFWIDPLEEDAEDQVDTACKAGVLGFKVICDRYYPYDPRPMEVFRKIATTGKPILFHSGILWDGKFSSIYCRPAGFEALIDIKGLKFSLAHASWPWIDECIALYGKFLNAESGEGPSTEMFIDITPGTPEIYRRELLTKLYTVGYDIENNIVFGLDCSFDTYADVWANKWLKIDNAIYNDLGINKAHVDKVFSGNLLRFVGACDQRISHRTITTTG